VIGGGQTLTVNHTASQTLNSQRSSEKQLHHQQPSVPALLNHKLSSSSAIRGSGTLKRAGDHAASTA